MVYRLMKLFITDERSRGENSARTTPIPMPFHNLKKLLRIFIFIILAMGLSACTLEASITDLNHSIFSSANSNEANGAEFVSGSNQYEHTLLRNYKINSSAGSRTKEIQSSTPRGYKMFSTVQGELISSEEIQ